MIRRRELILEAIRMAMTIRSQHATSLNEPLCPFDLAVKLGIDLRFMARPSLEGMYCQSPPAIIIGSERPIGRQTFTCAHEIGHHVFGHGTRVDEVGSSPPSSGIQPEEFLAQAFAGFLLMPKMAVSRAFSVRKLKPATAAPEQLFAISCYFGVGYTTLVDHLTYSLGELTTVQCEYLKRTNLRSIRANMGSPEPESPLIVADKNSGGRTYDLEIGDLLLVPADVQHEGLSLLPLRRTRDGAFWEASKRGISRLEDPTLPWSIFVRVRPKAFQGRAIYRNMPETEEE